MFAAIMALNDAVGHIWAAKPFQLSASEFPITFLLPENAVDPCYSQLCYSTWLTLKTLKSQGK